MSVDLQNYGAICRDVRKDILRMHARANSSHIGSAFSCVELLVSLFFSVMNTNPLEPEHKDRDKFILSKGHAVSALYAILAKRGFFDKSILDEYCVNGGRLFGHSARGCVPGVEVTTGSLAHGLSMGIGMSLAARHDHVDNRTFVLLSDGECNEGAVWEAAMFASHHRLDNLVAIIDYNKLQAFGRTSEVVELEPLADKWTAFGWLVKEVDGHNCEQIVEILKEVSLEKAMPSVIIANTVKGKGISFIEDKILWHYKSPNKKELESALKELDYT